jgi:hypothetical protein
VEEHSEELGKKNLSVQKKNLSIGKRTTWRVGRKVPWKKFREIYYHSSSDLTSQFAI